MTNAITLQDFDLGIEVTEKKKTVLSFLLIPILIATMFTAACSWSNVLADGIKILGYIPLAVNVALPLVCIDAPICPAATVAAKVLNVAQVEVLRLFQDWQAAAAANQPAILTQLQAAIQVLNEKYKDLLAAFKVTDPKISGEVGAICAAVLSSIQQIAQLTSTVLAAGGTKLAATKAIKSSQIKISPKQFKAQVLNALKVNTGNPVPDQLNLNLAVQVKGW